MMQAKVDVEPDAAEPRYDLIELMFFAYRDFVEDADRVLVDDGFGRAHHRVLYFCARRPGLTIAELLDILKITKQSLNRVLKELLDRGYVDSRLGEEDRRQRRLCATARGEALITKIAAIQSARFGRAFAGLGPKAEIQARAFLEAMLDQPVSKGAVSISTGRLGVLSGFTRFEDGEIARLVEGKP
jgi:DNA-binding MarR family transcriptional regulator